MLKVGVPQAVDPELHRLLPEGIALEVVPSQPERPLEVDFWITPPHHKLVAQAWPSLRGVRVVQSTLAGVDALLKLLPPDVTLCDARGVHDIPVAEWVLSAVLASFKYLGFYGDVRRTGIWKRRFEAQEQYRALHPGAKPLYPEVMVEELHGRRALIVGYGSIGRAVEERLHPFGVRIDRIARTPREGVEGADRLADRLSSADIVILTVPSTSETAGLIGSRELSLMKPGSLLVNVARGPVVDTGALLAALHSGRIRAALDVTDPEPLPEGHPLWSAPNLLLTPHVAGSTPMFMVRAMEFAAAQIRRCIGGQPLQNVVKGEY